MKEAKEISSMMRLTGLISAGCGVAYGLCHELEIPLYSLEKTLLFGPTALMSFFGIVDGISIAKTGKQKTGNYPQMIESELIKIIKKSDKEEFIKGELYAGIMGGLGEGLMAGFETGVGYITGRLIGKGIKLFS